jgi:lipid-A-disaccharide synthase-like uncharacterized protein
LSAVLALVVALGGGDTTLILLEVDRHTGAISAERVGENEVAQLAAATDGPWRGAFRLDRRTGHIDPVEVRLGWYWIAFGLGAQLLFTARMLAQWLASERAKASVVPLSFWFLSLGGGVLLLIYFVRRGDPVGVVGQLGGLLVYARNLVLIWRRRRQSSGVALSS